MNISNQFEKVGILFTNNRFVSILKQMSRTFVPEVEVDGIAGEKSAHQGGQSGLAWAEQEMNVVGHQRPSETLGTGLNEEFREVSKKSFTVDIVPEDIAAVNAANDHMLEQVGNIEAGGSWHEVTITSVEKVSQLINNVP